MHLETFRQYVPSGLEPLGNWACVIHPSIFVHAAHSRTYRRMRAHTGLCRSVHVNVRANQQENDKHRQSNISLLSTYYMMYFPLIVYPTRAKWHSISLRKLLCSALLSLPFRQLLNTSAIEALPIVVLWGHKLTVPPNNGLHTWLVVEPELLEIQLFWNFLNLEKL